MIHNDFPSLVLHNCNHIMRDNVSCLSVARLLPPAERNTTGFHWERSTLLSARTENTNRDIKTCCSFINLHLMIGQMQAKSSLIALLETELWRNTSIYGNHQIWNQIHPADMKKLSKCWILCFYGQTWVRSSHLSGFQSLISWMCCSRNKSGTKAVASLSNPATKQRKTCCLTFLQSSSSAVNHREPVHTNGPLSASSDAHRYASRMPSSELLLGFMQSSENYSVGGVTAPALVLRMGFLCLI